MQLPDRDELNKLNPSGKQLLAAFYEAWADQPWFDKAQLSANDPELMKPGIILNVHYMPIHQHILLREWCQDKKLGFRLILPFDTDSLPHQEGHETRAVYG